MNVALISLSMVPFPTSFFDVGISFAFDCSNTLSEGSNWPVYKIKIYVLVQISIFRANELTYVNSDYNQVNNLTLKSK